MLSDSQIIRKCGCGPVAALDLIWYLAPQKQGALTVSEYNSILSFLTRRYFLLIPPVGINGIMLVLGLNRLLHDRKLPYYAVWMVSGAKLWPRVEEMLRRDLPVILSVGSNFPLFWQDKRLSFYSRDVLGRYRRTTATKGHYVIATGIDDTWLRISSWGREYYINREEYDAYTKAHSNYVFSNLVYLYRRKQSEN